MILLLSDGTFIFVHNNLFVCLAKPHLMGLWVMPLVRPPTFFLKAHTWGDSQGLPGATFSQKTGSSRVNFWSRKKSQVKTKGSFCVLGRQVLPLVLFLTPVPPVLQPPAHSSASPGKPPSLHYYQGWLQGAPHSFQEACQEPWVLQSSLPPLTFPLQIEGALSSSERHNPTLLQEPPSDPKCKGESKTKQQLPSLPLRQAGTCCTRAGNGEQTHKPELGHQTGYMDYSLFFRITLWSILKAEFLSLPKAWAWKLVGAKMTPWCCHGQLHWLHSTLPICSKWLWCLYQGVTTNWCQSVAETWEYWAISSCARLFLCKFIYICFIVRSVRKCTAESNRSGSWFAGTSWSA